MSDIIHDLATNTKHVIDLAAFLMAIGGILDYMPKIAALMSVIWLAMQMTTWIRHRKWKAPSTIGDEK